MKDPNWALAGKQQVLAARAGYMQRIRDFFVSRGCLEVETPHRIPANAPESHINPVASGTWALHSSPEIAMKRLLAAGYDKLFQICRVWRDGERGRYHLPEFSMLEWYRTGVDYHSLMTDCEELLRHLVPQGRLSRAGRVIDLNPPWQRLSVGEAFDRYAPIPLEEALATDRFEEILTDAVEPQLGKRHPTFLIEYPAELAALARLKPGHPGVAERFELYIDGLELANAFSELVDPEEQRRRFEVEQESRRATGKSLMPLPEKFLEELAVIPEAAGIAMGLDRLIMLLTGALEIDDVVAFSPEQL